MGYFWRAGDGDGRRAAAGGGGHLGYLGYLEPPLTVHGVDIWGIRDIKRLLSLLDANGIHLARRNHEKVGNHENRGS